MNSLTHPQRLSADIYEIAPLEIAPDEPINPPLAEWGSVESLREVFPIGSTARTLCTHVSRSGMTRYIRIFDEDGVDHSPEVAKLIGWKYGPKHDGIKVEGCGMDMGFALVYQLASALYRGQTFVDRYGREEKGEYAVSHRWM